MKPGIRAGSLAALLLGLGCAGEAPVGDAGPTARDSLGVRIVENGDLDLDRELLVATDPALEIGVVDGPEELQLFRVSAATRLPDGGYAVANGGSREVRIYNADGSHRATVGGVGDGPSEFGYPVAVRASGADTIMVQDRLDRVFFTVEGDFVRRTTTDRQAMADLMERIGGRSEGGQWMPDGSFFARIHAWDRTPSVAGPPFRPSMTFVRIPGSFDGVDTLGVFGGILQQYVDVGEPRPSATVPPFSRSTTWGVTWPEGAVVAADNAVPQVELFLPDGARTIARWSQAPEPVTEREVEEWKARQRNASWTEGRLPQVERAWAAMDIPHAKPLYGRAVVGSDGTVWLGPVVEREGGGWRAFGSDGGFLGVARVPERFVPMDSGPGWLLGIHRDENEVEFLRLYALVQ